MDSKYRIEETLSAYKRLKDVQDNASNYKRKPESSVLIKKNTPPKSYAWDSTVINFLRRMNIFWPAKKKLSHFKDQYLTNKTINIPKAAFGSTIIPTNSH